MSSTATGNAAYWILHNEKQLAKIGETLPDSPSQYARELQAIECVTDKKLAKGLSVNLADSTSPRCTAEYLSIVELKLGAANHCWLVFNLLAFAAWYLEE